MKIIVFGANGKMGRAVAYDLCKNDDVEEVDFWKKKRSLRRDKEMA